MARTELRPIVKLRSTAESGYTCRMVLRSFDPEVSRHVGFRNKAAAGRVERFQRRYGSKP